MWLLVGLCSSIDTADPIHLYCSLSMNERRKIVNIPKGAIRNINKDPWNELKVSIHFTNEFTIRQSHFTKYEHLDVLKVLLRLTTVEQGDVVLFLKGKR